MNAITALREYGQAIRGDWAEIDGRSVLHCLTDLADAMEGLKPDHSIEWWRDDMGLCPIGGGHWRMYCDERCEKPEAKS